MTIERKIIQRISVDELDEILLKVAEEKHTNFALLGPTISVDMHEENWPEPLKKYSCVYQLTSFISDLCERLSNLSCLASLLLWSNQIGDAGAKYIPTLRNLTSLDLSDNQIGEAGVKHISTLRNLTSLYLWGNQIGDAGAKYIPTLRNLTTLNLSDNQIGEAGAKHISTLRNLTTLYLSCNQIGDAGAKYISALRNLTSLYLWSNQIGDAGAMYISTLRNLTSLDLRGNQIGDTGAKHIAELENLTTLDLGSNQIGDAGAMYISTLKNLTTLNLSDNQIEEAGAMYIAELGNLTALDLGSNQIEDAGAMYISTLKNLTSLNLSDNQIEEAGAMYIAKLGSLNTLDLSNNHIGDDQKPGRPSFLENLTSYVLSRERNRIEDSGITNNLVSLDLSKTAIKDLIGLSNLPFLRLLNISGTAVTDLSPVKNLLEQGIAAKWERYGWDEGIFVEDCPLIHPPPEIVKQGHAEVLNYFQEIEAQGVDKLLEAKVLIVGEGRAGKTSLLRRLYRPDEPLPTEDETTKGIDIHRHDFFLDNGRVFRLNIWDFGGQQIYHATHQFFLTKSSLYILLDDTAKDYKSVTDEGFRYWLEVIDLLSKHSPVLMFQNEKGGRSKKIDVAGIKGQFDNVKDVYRGNLEHEGSAIALSKAIELLVQQLPHVGQEVPAKWVDIRQDIEQKAERTPYISQQDYFDLYQRYLKFDRTKALLLSQYLHDLGVFLHFQDDGLLRNTVILQNRWATEAVFRILDDETVKTHFGRFTESDCARVWATSDYRDMHPELRKLMEKFELCYALPDLPTHETTWLAPQLLPPSIPSGLADRAKSGDLALIYRYSFLPKGLINRLMVRKHLYVERPNMAWASGVLFEHSGCHVLVQATPRGNEIVLRARGPEAKVLLSIIAADLDALNASFSGLEEKLEKFIPCNCTQCTKSLTPEMFEYKRLLKRKQDGKLMVECQGSYENISVLSLLDGFMLEHFSQKTKNPSYNPARGFDETTARSTALKTIKIFLASSEELRDDRDDLDLYFRQQNDRLLKEGIYLKVIRWENFLDAMSETRLQDEYNKAVRACDIFVSLFMTKTGIYTEEEFDVAHQAFQQNGKPRIYTYFKDAPTSTGNIDKAAMLSLWKFQEKLKELGHFGTQYVDIEHLKRHSGDQLTKLLDEKRI